MLLMIVLWNVLEDVKSVLQHKILLSMEIISFLHHASLFFYSNSLNFTDFKNQILS